MKAPHLLIFAVLIFGAGIFAGKMAFQNPGPDEKDTTPLSQRTTRSTTSRNSDRRDFSDQIQRAQALTKAGDREQEMILLLTDMVLSDPAQAVTLLGEISDLKLRSELAKEAAAIWISSDPEAAFGWLLEQPTSTLKKDMALTMFQKTTTRNPLIARRILEASPSLLGGKNIAKLASDWAHSDFAAAKQFVLSQKNHTWVRSGMSALLTEWGRQDPAAAILYVENNPELFSSYRKHFGLVKGWAEKDPAAAFEFAKGLKQGAAFTGATYSVLESWVKDDPQAAVRAMETISDKFYSSAEIAALWAKQDLDSAKEWLKNYDHRSRPQAMYSMVNQLADDDPRAAAQLYQEFTGWPQGNESDPEKLLSQAAESLASAWTKQNREEALTWISSLPENDTRHKIIRRTVPGIGREAPKEAMRIVDTLPPGDLRALTISNLVRELRQASGVQAFEASQLLINDQARLATTEELLNGLKHSPKIVHELLDQANIPEADRERIRGKLE